MSRAMYPGSFDPVTLGHLDIFRRSASIFDEVVIAVLANSAKSPLFSEAVRVKMIVEAVKDLPNVTVETFSGLTIDFARQNNIHVMIRGLRAVTDFEYELQIAQSNRKMAEDIDTMFLTTSLEYAYLSSSIVKEYARYGMDVSQLVPPVVAEALKEKYTMQSVKESERIQ